MIVYLPILFLALGAVVAYGSAGTRRQFGTMLIIAACGWSLALLDQPGAAAWVVGPLLATWLLPRPPERVRSTFEVLTRRAVTIAVFTVLALILSARLPFGENPLLLNVVPWIVGALGAAWVWSPIDAAERLQGQVLMVGTIGALLLVASPSSPGTALIVGLMATVPVLGERARLSTAAGPLLSSLMLMAAAVAVVWAAVGSPVGEQDIAGVLVNPAGPGLLGVGVVLVAGSLLAPAGLEWVTLIGVIALVTVAPSLRWAALGALVAVATPVDRAGERPAWFALASLAAVPFVHALAPAVWSARAQTVGLGVGVVVMVYAARHALIRVMVLPASAFLVLVAAASLSGSELTRLQWIVALGALLLLILTAFNRMRPADGPPLIVADRLLAGLLLLAISARDALDLGALAVAVILIDLSVVRLDGVPDVPSGVAARLVQLARSSWPLSATFTGATLAVIATLQASLALGLLSALMWAGLQLTPMVDHHLTAPAPERPRSGLRWLAPVVGLAVGLAPALVLRMLRL